MCVDPRMMVSDTIYCRGGEATRPVEYTNTHLNVSIRTAQRINMVALASDTAAIRLSSVKRFVLTCMIIERAQWARDTV